MSKRIYRTAIYVRLSKDDGDKEESNSIISQKAMCEDYIASHKDLKLVDVFSDDGYSGVDFNRPGFELMEQAIRDNKIDAVVCKDLSRFSRNYIDGGRYLQRIFPSLGIRFIAINDNYDTLNEESVTDSLVIPFKNLINDSYCKDISVKIRTNLDVKRRRGDYVGAYVPYGYKKDPQNKNKLIVDDCAGDIVRQIFTLFKDGLSVGQIADRLNSLGVLSPMEYKIASGINYDTAFRTGKEARWSYRAVKRILTNDIYIGILTQGKRGTPNYKVHVIQDREENEWIRVEGNHEALISYDDYMSVQELLNRDTRATNADNDENIYSGFLFCADCGQPMVRNVVRSGSKKYYYYVCSSNKRHEGCSSHSISSIELEKGVLGAIKDQVSNVLNLSETLEYINKIKPDSRAVFNYDTQIEKLTEEIEKYRKLKRRTYEDLSDGVISKSEYIEFKSQYNELIESKTEALENVKKEMEEATLSEDSERVWVSLFRKYDGIGDVTRRVLMALVDKIYVYEGHIIEISFKYGDEYTRAHEYAIKNADLLSGII